MMQVSSSAEDGLNQNKSFVVALYMGMEET